LFLKYFSTGHTLILSLIEDLPNNDDNDDNDDDDKMAFHLKVVVSILTNSCDFTQQPFLVERLFELTGNFHSLILKFVLEKKSAMNC
jgi:hypothetical protein